MNFLLDHDVPDDLSYLLQELAHEVIFLRKVLPEDAVDEAVLQFAYNALFRLLERAGESGLRNNINFA